MSEQTHGEHTPRIEAGIRLRQPGERVPGADQFWRCPRCDFGMGCGSPVKLLPPQCPFHKIECEQVTEDGFYAAETTGGTR